MNSTTNNTSTNPSSGIGSKIKGGVKVAHGLGDVVLGETRSALDSVEMRDSSVNDEIASRGRREIEDGIAAIKGKTLDSGTNTTGSGWGPGFNPEGTTNSKGFSPPQGKEYAQNSTTDSNAYAAGHYGLGSGINGTDSSATTNSSSLSAPSEGEYGQNLSAHGRDSTTTNRPAGAPTDLGRGPNAYSGNPSGNADSPSDYPVPGGPPPREYARTGLGNTHPTQLGNRPVGEREYDGRTTK